MLNGVIDPQHGTLQHKNIRLADPSGKTLNILNILSRFNKHSKKFSPVLKSLDARVINSSMSYRSLYVGEGLGKSNDLRNRSKLTKDVFYNKKFHNFRKSSLMEGENFSFPMSPSSRGAPTSSEYPAKLGMEYEKNIPLGFEERIFKNNPIKGIKLKISGRLKGVNMARSFEMKKGSFKPQTICSFLDYSNGHIYTK